MPHAELVARGYLKRAGGPLINAPAFTSVKHLIEQAGYVPAVPLEMLGLKTRAKAELARQKWLEDDEALRPHYGTDSEDEEAADAAEASGTDSVDEEDAAAPEGETQEERNKREALQTAREIKTAVVAAEGRYCWVVYHDGGYTAEMDATEKQPTRPAKAGWGYWERQLQIDNGLPEGDRALPAAVSQRTSYGLVQLDMDAPDYSGCVALSNNSAELSAVPQILVRILMWRKRRLDRIQQLAAAGRAAGLHDEAEAIDDIENPERPTTLVLVYDS